MNPPAKHNRANQRAVVLMLAGALATVSGCKPTPRVLTYSDKEEQVNNSYIEGYGYYHAPFNTYYPYPYNYYSSGKGYYAGGRWYNEPYRSTSIASRPKPTYVYIAPSVDVPPPKPSVYSATRIANPTYTSPTVSTSTSQPSISRPVTSTPSVSRPASSPSISRGGFGSSGSSSVS